MNDPRCNKRNIVDYPLPELMFLVISAAVSGVDKWTDIQTFGESKLDWLRKFFHIKMAFLGTELWVEYSLDWIMKLLVSIS